MFGNRWLLLLLLTNCLFAQMVKDSESLLEEAQLLHYNDPVKAIEIAGYVFSNSNSDTEKANALILIAESESIRSNSILAIENLQKAAGYATNADAVFLNTKIAGLLATQYRLSGFYEKGRQYLTAFSLLPEKVIPVAEKELLEASLFRERAFILLNEKKVKLAITYFRKAVLIYKSGNNYENKIGLTKTYNDIGQAYLTANNMDSAAYFFKKTLQLAEQYMPAAAFKTYAINGLGRIQFLKGDYVESGKIFSALLADEKVNDPFLKISLYKNLSDSYIALEDMDQYRLYNSKYKILNDSIYGVQKKTRLYIAKTIEKEQQEILKTKERHYYYGIIVIFLLLLVLFLGSYLYHIKVKREYKLFQEIMNSLESGEKLKLPDGGIQPAFMDTETMHTITIPESSIQLILEKLARFEESTAYTNPNMSLQLLAKQFDTNTKYVSEIINKNKHKNFKAYINELRINYIIDKMRNDKTYLNYKTSYLAQECGFVSRSTFTIIFKSVTGLAPAKFIDFLKKEQRAE